MTRLLELLISFAIVAVLFLIVGVVLPSTRHLEESVETNRKMTIVYDTLNSVRRFKDWNPLVLRDPKMQIKLGEKQEGVGARLDFVSEQPAIGTGYWEITKTEPNKSVAYKIEDAQRGGNKRTEFTLAPTGQRQRNVKITQSYDVDYGWDILGRYAGMYVSSNVGDDIKLGLSRLSNMLATVPNQDYSTLSATDPAMGPRLSQRPAENLLVVTAAVDRAKVQAQIKSNIEWIDKVIVANGLAKAGPLRIITNELGADMYSFDVAQPVRKSGATGEDAAAAAIETDGKIDVTVQGPVEARYVEPARIATASFKGDMRQLPSIRDTLRAWALTRGYETVDRPYENWKSGVDPSFTGQGDFDVFWVLK